MKRAVGFALLALCLLAAPAANAADPTFKFADNSAQTATKEGEQPVVALGDRLALKVEPGTPADAKPQIDPKKVTLRIDGSPLGGVPDWQPGTGKLTFTLALTENNRALWSRLLGAPLSRNSTVQVPIELEIDNKQAMFKDKDGLHPSAPITLVRYCPGLLILGILIAALVAAVTTLMCRYTTMMRDTQIPQMRRDDRTYSLGRFQMAVWFAIIFASFIFVYMMTAQFSAITTESFILLGISGATGLGSIAIENTKDSPVSDLGKQLKDMGIETLREVDLLYDGSARDTQPARQNGIPHAMVPGDPKAIPPVPDNDDPTIGELRDAYESRIEDFKSHGLLRDLVTDINGPTIHRWQILIWTGVLAIIYLGRVYGSLQVPEFGTNLLTLMGISSGIYIGFKIPETQSKDEKKK